MSDIKSSTGGVAGGPALVLIVDDHPLVRIGLRELIDAQPDLAVCADVGTLREAAAAIAEHHPALAVVDISLRGGENGLELVRQLRGQRTRVLVSSMHDDLLYAERAISAGAQGYINKQEAPEKLVQALRAVLAGRVYLNPQIVERMITRMTATGDPAAAPAASERNLSNRELEIFELLGRGKTIREIAEALHLSPKTVETHRQNIKAKLGTATSAELTARAASWRVGQ